MQRSCLFETMTRYYGTAPTRCWRERDKSLSRRRPLGLILAGDAWQPGYGTYVPICNLRMGIRQIRVAVKVSASLPYVIFCALRCGLSLSRVGGATIALPRLHSERGRAHPSCCRLGLRR